jgi:zinc protease
VSRPAISPAIRSIAALILAVAGLAAAPPPAGAAEGDVFPFPVHQTKLDNGLRVVVIPFDSPGVVAFYTVVRTGSREEVEAGHSGFAHFFEHMMFRGTKRFSADAYNDVLKRMGAESNAYTSDDQTVYHMVAPAAELPTIVDLEADRFKNLDYDEEGFKTEALAVLGEYNKNVSSPFLPMHEKLRELAFDAHTYEHTTMGFIADVKAMPGYYEYSRRFFDRFYRPENAILLVVGDAKPEAVFALAKQHYADWKPGYKPAEIKAEPAQKERRSAHIEWPQAIRPQMMVGYHAPAFTTTTTDTGALDLLAQLLFSETAPLYREVVIDKQWADALGGGAADHRDPYLFTINARVKSPDLLPKVKAATAPARTCATPSRCRSTAPTTSPTRWRASWPSAATSGRSTPSGSSTAR